MADPISSAGLVYVYLNGYQEGDALMIQPVDTYHYMGDDFYQKVTEKTSEEQGRTYHMFVAVGAKERAAEMYSILANGIRENFQRILDGKTIRKSMRCLDRTGNVFFQCVQELFCERPGHFPVQIAGDYGSFAITGISCSRSPAERDDRLVDQFISLWVEREAPFLHGQQLMIRSFLFRDLVGRKVIACIPQMRTGDWSLILEGGHQLMMDEELSYVRRAMHPDDLGAFSSSTVQTILMNPIYAYGKCFYPDALCDDWHKVFLYLCAVVDVEWEIDSISKVYEEFLTVLQSYICETVDAEAIIPKETYWRVLLVHIQRFRKFLSGEDEPVISKDLHRTINCRYVYLPYLWPLVPHRTESAMFSPSQLHSMVRKAMGAHEANSKGKLWEETAAYVLQSIPGWRIKGHRVRTDSQEIDISVVNVSLDGALWQLGAYILVECKNWSAHVTLPEIRNLAHISTMKGNKTAILFSANGITQDAEKEIDRLASEGISIILVTANDLLQIQNTSDSKTLILDKWQRLQDAVNISTMM